MCLFIELICTYYVIQLRFNVKICPVLKIAYTTTVTITNKKYPLLHLFILCYLLGTLKIMLQVGI